MSLRRSFVLVFSALLTVLAGLAALYSYHSARQEAWSILDFQQQQIARLVGDGSGIDSMLQQAPTESSDEVFAIKATYTDGRPEKISDDTVHFPAASPPGFSNFVTGATQWRLFTRQSDTLTVMVAQRTSERDELAADAALNSTWPFLVAIPLFWICVYWLVGAVMERLQALADKVEARDVEDMRPLGLEDIPQEVRPLVTSINRAFERVQLSLDQQRAFLADAAHELRTPLAALSLQVANVRQARDDDERRQALGALESGVRRASQVAGQLLRLARSEALAPTGVETTTIDLVEVGRETLSRMLTLADAKDIDLGLKAEGSTLVRANRADMATLLEVLIDNALRYTQLGGVVDLIIAGTETAVVLRIEDTGPGIPPELQGRVFDRFFRIHPEAPDGSGLGLAIALSLARRCGASISLANRQDRSGLSVAVTFSPVAPLA